MKKIIPVIGFVLAACIFCSKNENAIPKKNGFELNAIHSIDEILIDGILDETTWQHAEEVFLRENMIGEKVTMSSVQTSVKTCYDEQNLYIAFECNDQDIWGNFTKRDQHLWEEEAVEVFIDVDDDPNTYVEVEVSPDNVLFDSYIVDPINIDVEATARFDLANINTAVNVIGTVDNRQDIDHKWIVEIAIPFTDMIEDFDKLSIKNSKWKINFYRINQDYDQETAYFAWSPTGGRFHKPSVFGTLVFE